MVAPDYRLSPENEFPIPLCDSYTCLQWLSSKDFAQVCETKLGGAKADLGRVVVAGDSAGGNMGLLLGLLVRDGLDADLKKAESKVKIAQLLLVYPSVNVSDILGGEWGCVFGLFLKHNVHSLTLK